MSFPYDRPVTAEALVGSPEWQLRHPGETTSYESRYDEGEGHSFDRMVKSALIIRHCENEHAGISVVRAWYYDQLGELGWTEVRDARDHHMTRNECESFYVSSPLEVLPALGNEILRSPKVVAPSFQAEPIIGSYDVRYDVAAERR